MEQLTFRDFAGAIMGGDTARAADVLGQLLEIEPGVAAAAVAHFGTKTSDPAFMVKAMGLRTAVTSGTDEEITTLLGECFGLQDAARATALAALRKRYPASPNP